jgi:hypothetical protein
MIKNTISKELDISDMRLDIFSNVIKKYEDMLENRLNSYMILLFARMIDNYYNLNKSTLEERPSQEIELIVLEYLVKKYPPVDIDSKLSVVVSEEKESMTSNKSIKNSIDINKTMLILITLFFVGSLFVFEDKETIVLSLAIWLSANTITKAIRDTNSYE